jgi:hypothetical protein
MNELITNLRNTLVEIYPELGSAKRIADDASINLSNTDLHGSIANVWHSILQEAIKVDRVDKLLKVVQNEYKENSKWQKVYQDYQLARQKAHKEEKVTVVVVDSNDAHKYTSPSEFGIKKIKEKLLHKNIWLIMFIIVLLLVIFYIFMNFLSSVPKWEYISGRNMTLSSLIVHNGYLYLGIAREDPRNHGLYRTDIRRCSNGLSLTKLIGQKPIYDIAFNNNQGLATTEDGVLYQTMDDGDTWKRIVPQQMNSRVYTVSYVGQSAYAGSEQYYVYTANKENLNPWTALSQGPQDINTLEYYGGELWIGTYNSGVWKLAIIENRFSNQSEGLIEGSLQVWDIILAEENYIFIATSDGVFISDGVSSWKPIGLQGKVIFSLEIAQEYLYAGTKGEGAFLMPLSTLGKWTKFSKSDHLNISTVRELVYEPLFCKGLLAATNQGVWLLKLP